MSPEFEIESVVTPKGTTVLRVRGRLDVHGAPKLSARCAEERGRRRNLVINLAGVTFISSSGVGALLAMVEECRLAETRVRLARVSPAVDSVIRLLNLQQFLSISPTEEQATSTLEAA